MDVRRLVPTAQWIGRWSVQCAFPEVQLEPKKRELRVQRQYTCWKPFLQAKGFEDEERTSCVEQQLENSEGKDREILKA